MTTDERLRLSTPEHGSRPDMAGMAACFHCRHDAYLHNRIQGCPYCRCAATPHEAMTDPTGEYGEHRILAPEEYLHDWQRPKPEAPQRKYCEDGYTYSERYLYGRYKHEPDGIYWRLDRIGKNEDPAALASMWPAFTDLHVAVHTTRQTVVPEE